MLAITGGKGGTGKTTTALGVAALLAKRRRDPVVVDADVDMPNLHIRAGTDDAGLERLAGGEPLEDAATGSSVFPGVDIVGARPGAELGRALRAIGTDRPVILDGASGAGERAVSPLRHADAAVVVTRDTPASMTDTAKTVRMARAIDTPVVSAVVSRASDLSDNIATTLRTETIVAVPRVEDPITHPTVRDPYSQIVDSWINA